MSPLKAIAKLCLLICLEAAIIASEIKFIASEIGSQEFQDINDHLSDSTSESMSLSTILYIISAVIGVGSALLYGGYKVKQLCGPCNVSIPISCCFTTTAAQPAVEMQVLPPVPQRVPRMQGDNSRAGEGGLTYRFGSKEPDHITHPSDFVESRLKEMEDYCASQTAAEDKEHDL